jgi:hypothetical protein
VGIFCRAEWGDFVIHVEQQPEPNDFNQKVRLPGYDFLKNTPKPQGKNAWKNHEYWQESLTDLYEAYNHICSYTSAWMPCPTGSRTVDHFIPKSVEPDKAYEWSNFRLSCARANTWKGVHRDILDPFQIGCDWFIIDFPLMEVKPNPSLDLAIQKAVNTTIEKLKLNGFECRKGRETWFNEYCTCNITFDCLERRAPFIAHELKRQDLVQKFIDIKAKAKNVNLAGRNFKSTS